jgi:hypothetical protein
MADFWFPISLLPLVPLYLVYFANRRVVAAKRGEVEGMLMRPDVYVAYARGHNLEPVVSSQQHGEVERLLNRHYRQSDFMAPMMIDTLFIWLFTLAGLSHVARMLELPSEAMGLLSLLPVSCLRGFLGGYVWALYQVVVRFRSRDFTPYFAHSIWVGLITASLTAGFVGSLGTVGANAFVQYAIGFLPTLEIVSWLQTSARRLLRAKEAKMQSEPPTLHYLQGATRSTILRLAEEGVESAHQLAYVDPFLLLLRTNLAWVDILDLVDQALLFNYLQERMKLLEPAGIRGAVEFARVFEDSGKVELIDSLSTKIDSNAVLVRNLVQTLHEDYQVNLIIVLFAQAYGEK